MDSNELTDKSEVQAHESETEGELAEPAESDDMALTHDDLDEVAGGRARMPRRKRVVIINQIEVGRESNPRGKGSTAGGA